MSTRSASTCTDRFVLALASLITIVALTPSEAAAPPGPLLTAPRERAIADLKAANLIGKTSSESATAFISGSDFAQLLLRSVNIDIRTVLNRPRSSPTNPALAAAAINKLHLATGASSFSQPARPVTREDAVTIALNAAAFTGHLRPGAVPRRYPRFQDESQFSDSRSRAAAHEAVAAGLISVEPDNRFNPKAPLQFGDAAVIVNSIREAKSSPEKE